MTRAAGAASAVRPGAGAKKPAEGGRLQQSLFRRIRSDCSLRLWILGNVRLVVGRERRIGRVFAVRLLLGVWLANGIHFFILGK